VADQSCSQIQALVAGAQLKVLDGAQGGHPLKGISEGLRQQREAAQPIRTLHLIAHGRPGAFRIGDVWIDAEALKAHATELAHWGVETIALWSCHVGADADFVALLAELSGAQVLASADWLGRDGDGNEQLQLGDWALADLLEPRTWPASFRLASGVPDGLDPEGVRVALEGGKRWGATDQARYDAWAAQQLSTRNTSDSGLSIEQADGSGICAEDELLFKATGKNNGYVSIALTLNKEDALPPGSQVWFSTTGKEDSWDADFDSGDLTQLSETGEGYVKVKLPDKTKIGSTLNAEIKQWDIQLGERPIISIDYNQLVLDDAYQVSGDQTRRADEQWKKLDDNGNVVQNTFGGNGKYRYENIFPQLKEDLGLELIADVSFSFDGVRRFIFDDPRDNQAAGRKGYQLLLQEGKGPYTTSVGTWEGDKTQGDAWLEYDWTFWLKQGDNLRQAHLKNFVVNATDVDTAEHKFVGEFDAEYIQTLDSLDPKQIKLPDGEGSVGEMSPHGDPEGRENLLRDRGNGKYLGARQFDVHNGFNEAAIKKKSEHCPRRFNPF